MRVTILSLLKRIFCPEQHRRQQAAERLVDDLIHLGAISTRRKHHYINALLNTGLSSRSIARAGSKLILEISERNRLRKIRRLKRKS